MKQTDNNKCTQQNGAMQGALSKLNGSTEVTLQIQPHFAALHGFVCLSYFRYLL